MKINTILTVLGAAMLTAVFFRTNKISWAFVLNTAPILVAMAVFAWINFRLGGRTSASKGFAVGKVMAISFLPALAIMFLTMGQAMVLLSDYKDEIKSFLSGSYGLQGTVAAAGIMPGSITGLPIVKEMWYQGISRNCLLLFLLASPLINWQILFFKVPMLGWRLTAIQFLFSAMNVAMMTVAFKALPVLWGLMAGKTG